MQYTYLVFQSIFSVSELPAFEDLSNTGNSPLRNFLQSVVSYRVLYAHFVFVLYAIISPTSAY